MPSVVARGIRKSPWACSPLTCKGPAKPRGTCTTPVKFSMLPLVTAGSNECWLVCFSFAPVAFSTKARRAATMAVV